jgi:hypothetical protein
MIKFLIHVFFIGISLHTFYFYQIGSPIISIISLFLLTVIILKDFTIKINTSNYTFYFFILILFTSFISSFYFDDEIVPTKFIGFIIVLTSCFVANVLYRLHNIYKLILFYLTFHIIFFYIQFFSFYLFKIHIDFLFPITGEEQRVFGGSFELPYFNSFMRACGLFNEPGTYVTFIAPFLVLFGRWRNIFNKKEQYIYALSLASLFLSFSVFGIVFGILIILFASFYNKKTRIIIGSFLSFTIIIPYITYRFFFTNNNINTSTDSGLGFREVFLSESYKFITKDLGAFLFGSGHLSINPKAKFIASFNDIGLIPYLIHFSGPFLTTILLLYLFKLFFSLDKFAIFGVVILFISKLSILAPFFPFLLTLLLWPFKEIDLSTNSKKKF